MATIVLLTDFGTSDFYVGQIHGVFDRLCPRVKVIDLCHHLPAYDIQSAAFLLPELIRDFPAGTVFMCVVDPTVGSDQKAVVLLSDQYWLVGPDNGLLSVVHHRSSQVRCHEVSWRPKQLSSTFHGRDLYAPVAAGLAIGTHRPMQRMALDSLSPLQQVPEASSRDLWKVIYIDHYGNCITGIHGSSIDNDVRLKIGGHLVCHHRAFFDATAGQLFWHTNSLGLVELAITGANAAETSAIRVGDAMQPQSQVLA